MYYKIKFVRISDKLKKIVIFFIFARAAFFLQMRPHYFCPKWVDKKPIQINVFLKATIKS